MTQKQVRRSKKELAHEANMRASITRRRHKAKSKALTTVFTDFDAIFENCGLPDARDLATTIDALIRAYREGGRPTDAHARAPAAA